MHRELVTKMIPSYFMKILDQFCFCLLIHILALFSVLQCKTKIIGSASPSNEMCWCAGLLFQPWECNWCLTLMFPGKACLRRLDGFVHQYSKNPASQEV